MSVIRQLPTGIQRATSLMLRRNPIPFPARVSEDKLTKKRRFLWAELLLSLFYCTTICARLLDEFKLLCLGLLPSALAVNSDCPPFLSLNQSFGFCTYVSLPSKQLWLRCWPRFTVLLEQYVMLCLGNSLWMHSHVRSAQLSHVCRTSLLEMLWRHLVWVY